MTSAERKSKLAFFFFTLILSVSSCFIFIKPSWKARLIAQFVAAAIISIIVLIYGINPKSRIIGSVDRSDKDKRTLAIILRILIIGFGLFSVGIAAYPTACDLIHVVRSGAGVLLIVRGRVVSAHSLYGLFCLHQDVSFVRDGGYTEEVHSAIFLPRIAKRGLSYMFVIAPKSGTILDEINIAAPPTNNVDRLTPLNQSGNQ
jgi:hypothetical protein